MGRRLEEDSEASSASSESDSESCSSSEEEEAARRKTASIGAKQGRKRKKEKGKREKKKKKSKKVKRKGEEKRKREERDATNWVSRKRLREGNQQAGSRANELVSLLGYSNEDNPFGDSQLTKQFVWAKKEEVDAGTKKKRKKDPSKRGFKDRIRELEEVRSRRLARIEEQAALSKKREEDQRQKEAEIHGSWEDKEAELDRIQEKYRSRVRLRNNRPRALDFLYLNSLLKEEHDNHDIQESLLLVGHVEPELRPPLEILNSIPQKELEELNTAIRGFISQQLDVDLWKNILVLLDDLIVRKREGKVFDARINQLLRGKNEVELVSLKDHIVKKRLGQGIGDDIYWRDVLDELAVSLARIRSEEANKKLLRCLGIDEETEKRKLAEFAAHKDASKAEIQEGKISNEKDPGESLEKPHFEHTRQVERFDEVDNQFVMTERDEFALPQQVHSWFGEHEPRKPRYFNRVHTGFDWNKYNKAHFDKENPPPKMVQGYKFNIYYPDLIDKTQAPKYKLEPFPGDDNYLVIRFVAGPPYLDIAFQIMNREWRFGKRAEVVNKFEKGVLHLHFQLKKYGYRR